MFMLLKIYSPGGTLSLTCIKHKVHENVEDETQNVISTVSVSSSGGVTAFGLSLSRTGRPGLILYPEWNFRPVGYLRQVYETRGQ